MKRFACMILLVCLFLTVIGGCATVKVDSSNYKATLLFFEGGLGLLKQGPDWLINRCNYGFAKEGIRVEFMPLAFNSPLDRLSEKHFLSIQEKVDSLKKRGHKRVWLMGISMGALSVANAGCHGINNVEGIIIINPAKYVGPIHLYCGKLVLPILIVTHEKDGCYERYLTTEDMKSNYPDSPHADIVVFSGGHVGTGPKALYRTQQWQHGLRGLEKEFIKKVSDFVAAN